MDKHISKQLPGLLLFLFCLNTFFASARSWTDKGKNKTAIVVRTAIAGQRLTAQWKAALVTRMSGQEIDSFGNLRRALSVEEIAWKKSIESKVSKWNSYRDSLAIAFSGIVLPDTIVVLIGFLGVDDAFTYQNNTLCLDLTALYKAYGEAGLMDNSSRIDRIFCHEYSHLQYKAWARKENNIPVTFKDSILWECWYEGIGMYRSLNSKWLPVNDLLPAATTLALDELYPVFTERITRVELTPGMTSEEKIKLNANLSRGPVNKKWGAFPVAIWLALEANGNDKKLVYWINRGPQSVIELAKKYITPEYREKLKQFFK